MSTYSSVIGIVALAVLAVLLSTFASAQVYDKRCGGKLGDDYTSSWETASHFEGFHEFKDGYGHWWTSIFFVDGDHVAIRGRHSKALRRALRRFKRYDWFKLFTSDTGWCFVTYWER